MSPSQVSSDDFPRLAGARNSDVWKARVSALLDGKHHLGFVTKKDHNGVSDDEDEDSAIGSDMPDDEDTPNSTVSTEIDSEEVDFEDSLDELQPSDGDNSNPSGKKTEKPVPSSACQLCRMAAQTKTFLMKTMDDTHICLVKNLMTAFDIFQTICTKYDGAAFHGEPYFIQHFLMEIKYEEGSGFTNFFLELENAMKAASEATEYTLTDGQKSLNLSHSMPKSWKDDLRVWKDMRKFIPYEELKVIIEAKVRELQAQECYSLAMGTPESQDACRYCQKPRYNICQCRGLQKNLRSGTVKAGMVLPAHFELRGTNNYRSHPYNNDQVNSNRGGGSWYQGGRGGRNGGRGRGGNRGNNNNSNNGNNNNSNNKNNSQSSRRYEDYDQSRRKDALVAVVSAVQTDTSAVSLRDQANTDLDTSRAIDSGCSSHVTQHAEWFKTKTAANGVSQRQYNLLSVAAAVDNGYRFNFKWTMCSVHTNQRFNIKAMKYATSKLYQLTALPA
ncbi:hypothetical protein F441_05219 [Phytophthora nicotianae CJ01A1]|uniref:Uncharacterized protein n=1 Tax=Phytophthora nicotianae CJ01A1 TaxID=1317063 RepID=W2XFQ6_PHYNI|nr:hypothetical protein F441_05219 [Phytophthora nicotianae CJ01A1]